jgi:hypothetical protein
VLLATLLTTAALVRSIGDDVPPAPAAHPSSSWVATAFPVAQASARDLADSKSL